MEPEEAEEVRQPNVVDIQPDSTVSGQVVSDPADEKPLLPTPPDGSADQG